MPECPEVERVVRDLRPLLVGGTIARHRSTHFVFPTLPAPMHIESMHRHGKWMVLRCGAVAVLMHLGMAGSFRTGGPLARHVRWMAIIERPDGTRTLLQYVDPRCMGRLRVLSEEHSARILRPSARSTGCPEIGLGPDVLSPALRHMDAMRVRAMWRTRLQSHFEIKPVLMMQHVVAGLGNIYAAEACWLARTSPFRTASTLSERQIRLLADGVPDMLRRACALGGTSLGDANSFAGMDRREGTAQRVLQVYGRDGLRCTRCGNTIKKCVQRKRSTYWCDACQT